MYPMTTVESAGPVAESNPGVPHPRVGMCTRLRPRDFPEPPVIKGHPYDYGVPGSVHGVFPNAIASAPAAGTAGGGQ